MDWRHAIAANTALASEQRGSTLFADISGFTPLTEAFALELGPKRGGEELTTHLNRVYDQLISVLHDYHGSVIGFSGDSITCWFDQDLDGRHAVRCALEMQEKMEEVAQIKTQLGREIILGLKVTVAIGSVKRFMVGMADYTFMDAMAGKTVERMATAESFAKAGDVVIDYQTFKALSDHLTVSAWHEDPETKEKYAAISSLSLDVQKNPWPAVKDSLLSFDQIDEWLLPAVASRINSGLGDFLTELRPAAALFLRFTGIQFDTDNSAPDKLREFIQSVQRIIMRLEGSLIQLTIGDKGSYLYAAFGAPIAHENDVERAALAALALQEECAQFTFINSLQIGISHGLMRTGAYGGSQRRTYGVLGDHVNLSARLMSKAPAGQIYISQRAQRKISKLFEWEQLPPMQVKGKAQPIQVHRLVKSKLRQAIRLNEPEYSLPMIGRESELQHVTELIEEVLEGKGQIIGITAEAGMGKSRLSAEVIRLCMDDGMSGYGGECQSFGTNTSYLVWQPILQSLFHSAEVTDEASTNRFLENLTEEITLINQSLVPRIPLLGPLLQIDIPENDLTKSLDAKTRKTSLQAFIVDVILAKSLQQPIILVFEDCHWLDPLSLELIEVLGRSIEQSPIFLLLVYRPPDSLKTQLPQVHELPNFTEITLDTFSKDEAEKLIKIKVEQYFDDSSVPQKFINLVIKKAAGNPFYLDEIINFIKDKEINLEDERALEKIDLPNTIYSLVLSRIDNLTESQKMAIKVASVIGRLFTAAMVWGVYPTNEITTMVKQDLNTLSELELTPVEQPEPELTYLFKHIVTQEVAYESLPYKTRAKLHGQIGDYIEFKFPDDIENNLNILAFHFDKSENFEKKKEYLLRAGDASKANYANEPAIQYFSKSLDLLSPAEQVEVIFKLGEIKELVGDWEQAKAHYQDVRETAESINLDHFIPKSYIFLGELYRKRGDYEEAAKFYDQALSISENLNDKEHIARSFLCRGTLAAQQGSFELSIEHYNRSLQLYEEINDEDSIAKAYNNMSVVGLMQPDFESAKVYQERALEIRRKNEDKFSIANSLSNLGAILYELQEYQESYDLLTESLKYMREIGEKWSIANTLNNLGNSQAALGFFQEASNCYTESLAINSSLGAKWALAYLIEDIASLIAKRDGSIEAIRLAGAAAKLREEIESPLSNTMQEKLDEKLASARDSDPEGAQEKFTAGRDMELADVIEFATNLLSA